MDNETGAYLLINTKPENVQELIAHLKETSGIHEVHELYGDYKVLVGINDKQSKSLTHELDSIFPGCTYRQLTHLGRE